MESSIARRFEDNLEAIRSSLEAAGAVLGYLFGSAARNLERADSDLDVAILLDGKVPEEQYGDLRLRLLTELVGLTHTNDVDLVILNVAPPLLAFQVVSGGRLFMGGRLRQVRFEVEVIRRYIDTRPLRKRHAESFRKRARREPPVEREHTGRW